jgi:dolichol kinase
MGTVIAFTVFWYSNLSGPALAAGIFLTVLIYSWAHKSTLITELLVAGSREGETSRNTFASGFMGMVSFGLVFVLFFERPEIIVAAILSVIWGDAAGELVGRPLGGKFISKPRANKSIEGAFGVFIFTTLSLLMSIALHSHDTCPFCVLPQLLFIGFVIAFVETVSIGWTDNFLIPFITSILMWQLLFPGMTLFPIVI